MNGFIHRIPFFRLFIALAIGILFASWLDVPLYMLIAAALVAIICISVIFYISDATQQFSKRWLFGGGILLLLACIGVFELQMAKNQVAFPFDGMNGTYLTEVVDAPIEKAKSTLYKVNVLSLCVNGKFQNINKISLLYLPKDSTGARFDFGDKILVSTVFASPRSPGNPEEFDFGQYLKLHGISAAGYAAKGHYKCVEKGHGFSLHATSSHLRQKLLDVYRKNHIEGDEFAVVSALMLGYNDALTRELMDSYSVTGAMHVLSVSGLHVAIICAVFYFLLGFMDKKRSLFVAKHLIVIVLLWAFAFLTGLSPAVVRSALMFSLMAFGYVVLRKPQIYNTIFFSAFIMLLYDPNYLFDVGFQLSYLAVISIVYFEPKFKKLLTVKFKPLKWLWELTCVSAAAQLGTAALGVFYFHRFANFFWLSNMVVVPLSGFIMYAAMALLVFSSVPVVGPIVAFILKWLLISMNEGIRIIEHLPFAAYNMWLDSWQLVISSAAIILITTYFSTKKFSMLVLGMSCVLLFLVDDVVRTYQSAHKQEVIVLADAKSTHVQFACGTESSVFSTDSLKMKQLLKAYFVKNGINTCKVIPENAILFCGKHFLVTNDSLFRRKTSEKILKVDYLIIGNKTRITMEKLRHFVEPNQVIIDHTISAWYSRKIKSECDSLIA